MNHRLTTLCILSALFSCGVQPKENLTESESNHLLETKIASDGFVYKSYGEKNRLDSVLIFNLKNQRYCKEYYLANKLLRRSFYGENNTTEEHLYEASSRDTSGNYYIIQYNAQKQIVAKGSQGIFNGMGVPVGTWHQYHNEVLVRELYYHNDESGKDYIRYKVYDENGNVSESYSNNFILHETDSISLSRAEYLLRMKQ